MVLQFVFKILSIIYSCIESWVSNPLCVALVMAGRRESDRRDFEFSSSIFSFHLLPPMEW